MAECISCIKDGKTGICRDVKDKTSRAKIEEVTEKLNEVIEQINNGGTGGVSTEIINQVNNHEERITTVESSVSDHESRLQDIENGGGGVVDPWDMTIPNDNLLINPLFTINQRGKISYESLHCNSKYCVDMWKRSTTFKLDVLDQGTDDRLFTKGIQAINNTSASVNLRQYIEKTHELYGEGVTFTVKTENGTYTLIVNIPESFSANTVIGTENTSFGSLEIGFHSEHLYVAMNINAGVTVTFIATKLEYGYESTPIHNVDPTLELLKCQRYLYIHKDSILKPITIEKWSTNTAYDYIFTTPVKMRKVPSCQKEISDMKITVVDTDGIFKAVSYSSNSSIQSANYRDMCIGFNVSTTNTLPDGVSTLYEIGFMRMGSNLVISAEMES